MPTPDQTDAARDLRTAAGVVFSIGIRPCSGAVLVLAVANLFGILWAGLAAVVAMSVGTAIAVATLALIVVSARHWVSTVVTGDGTRLALGDWLSWARTLGRPDARGLAMVRAIRIFNRDFDPVTAERFCESALDMLEFRLNEREWLALDRFTLADLACYPYAALVHEGEVPLDSFPSIREWFRRIEAMPGYVAMPGLPYPG